MSVSKEVVVIISCSFSQLFCTNAALTTTTSHHQKVVVEQAGVEVVVVVHVLNVPCTNVCVILIKTAVYVESSERNHITWTRLKSVLFPDWCPIPTRVVGANYFGGCEVWKSQLQSS